MQHDWVKYKMPRYCQVP